MCGIAGLIANAGTQPFPDLIQQMTDAVAHRGPDGQGIWSQGSVALGHRRLSIIDLSELGKQPMADEQTGCVVTYNGEIYNYIELRNELIALGRHFRSGSDTEVLLSAYEQWGSDCVRKFNGMWAFAIFDPRRNIVFCSRDRFGVKPFYYADTAAGFGFGSEIRQLLPLFREIKANARVAMNFLVSRVAEDIEGSFFAGVNKLPGGHNLIYRIDSRSYTVERFYELTSNADVLRLDGRQALEGFDSLFKDAIRLRLRSDVKVGTCLSGGMDSSSIAAIAGEMYRTDSDGQAFSAITAISEDPLTDESGFAKQVVDRAGLNWITVRPDYNDFDSAIDAVVRTQEEPFASTSIFMQYFVMQEARRAGITVLLDGQGGDEILLGYERYFADHFAGSLLSARFGNAIGVLGGLGRNGRPGALKALLWNLAYFHAPGLRRAGISIPSSLFSEQALAAQSVDRTGADGTDLFALQKREIGKTNLPVLLRYEDKNSMAHAIETRLPFLDYRLVEFSTSLATELKLTDGWGKHLLRKAMETRLPAEIVWRKHKFGFESPESRWMRSHASAIDSTLASSDLIRYLCARDALKREELAKINQGLRWRLYSLAKWAETFGVGGLSFD
ncbi:asparagine synthase (glutamine-hydrolyzing) [Rhizobium sp. BE258]|uniref:asparagine synthase (glutamine-hydrolyzing) n=1 Tax=Rhizobium sp. BE258 TaxID=2817722 RepID=UPI0028564DA2|nr:asparagine synthase (glutamine-hydrolyzing) [Rhizobium sp. BE258]MDR7142212.1 asparagine synthase (glutamine-hydrolyzing) [Rhizobium sp. BE258]